MPEPLTEDRTESDAVGGSRAAILAAAAAEFVERGYAGARMEHIARRAGYNKALVYRHFGDRAMLFEAVLESVFAGRRAVLERQPRGLADVLAAWSDASFAAPAYGKLLMREALEHEGAEPALADERRRYYAEQVAGVATAQARGRLPAGMEAKHLFLALLAVTNLPALLPNVTGLVSGEDPKSDAFQKGWRKFLKDLAKALAPSRDAR